MAVRLSTDTHDVPPQIETRDVPLLTTKLYIPTIQPGLVSRPRLIERLNEGLSRKLTLLSAPAGFGKTTLLSEWVAGCGQPIAWLSLEGGDNDLARFLSYIIAALQQVDARLGQTTQTVLRASQLPDTEALIAPLINEIAALGTSFVLILDDYHVITLPANHDALSYLLDHMPSQMHLVIASRADPPLHFSRLRVRRQVLEMRTSDLRFTEGETAAFLNQTMGLNLTPESIAALAARTEGWIAGLQLAALSMGSLEDAQRRDFVAALSGDDRYILDYLVEEVLDRQPPHVQTFLLQTSILERLSGPLCETVWDGGSEKQPVSPISGQGMLAYLENRNLFLVPLDHKRGWYRYHHLFADLLRSQLEASEPDLVPTLHRRASAWYAGEDILSEAIAHSLAARDWDQAAQLIYQAFSDVCCRGEYYTTLLGWLRALPDQVVHARPHLGVLYAWMLAVALQLDAAEARLQVIETTAHRQLPADLRLQIASIRATVARQQYDIVTAIELSHRVLEALAQSPSSSNALARTGIILNLAWAHLVAGDAATARRWFSEAQALDQVTGSITLTLDTLRGLARVQAMQGQLDRAVGTYRQALQLADRVSGGQAVPAAAPVHLELGDLLRERNELDEAARHIARGVELCRQCQILVEDLRNSYIYQARLKQAQGDVAGALDVIRQAEPLARAYQAVPRFGGPIAACRARLTLAQATSAVGTVEPDHLKAVSDWAGASGLSTDSSIDVVEDELAYAIWARLLIAQGEPEQALQLLFRMQQAAEHGGRTGYAIEILALQALAHRACGDVEQARVALERALSLAERGGYVRVFVDEGAPMAELLQAISCRRSAVSHGYVEGLLSALKPDEPETLPFESLTAREMEVLRLLRTELSGPEIAGKLCVSANTVKTHIKRIYDKLGVHSRYEAVERARELGLT